MIIFYKKKKYITEGLHLSAYLFFFRTKQFSNERYLHRDNENEFYGRKYILLFFNGNKKKEKKSDGIRVLMQCRYTYLLFSVYVHK